MELYEKLEVVFQIVILYASLAMEMIGVCILIITALKSVGGLLRKEPTVQLQLSKGVSLTLAFFMGGEVLRTVTAHEKTALLTLGAIVLLRAAMTLLLHWEMKNETHEHA